MASASTPIKIARRRALFARRGLMLGTALAFGVTFGLARASHPASAARTSSPAAKTSTPASQAAPQTSSGFGAPSIGSAPSSQAPSVSTGVS